MRTELMRGAFAALLAVLAPTVAGAQTLDAGSAIATGLAIPSNASLHAVPAAAVRGRAVLVDATSARLFMLEDGQVVDSMRVIVGKGGNATPTIQSTLYYATLNPYWYVPPSLAREAIAPRVLKEGMSYFNGRGYEVVSGFSRDAEVVPASSVDWKAVAAGRETVYIRQRPGRDNSMGRLKFGFDNSDGIFLHDTPRKELFDTDQRALSHGCVRLEDADRLARWLLGREPDATGEAPEQFVALPRPVPIVITYMSSAASTQMASLR
ncbi:MAG: L,D-transpeptidase family protein [Sphingomicrobium sp.]